MINFYKQNITQVAKKRDQLTSSSICQYNLHAYFMIKKTMYTNLKLDRLRYCKHLHNIIEDQSTNLHNNIIN